LISPELDHCSNGDADHRDQQHRTVATPLKQALNTPGIVNLSGRGMLVVWVARQLGSGNSFDRLFCCPAQAERDRKRRSGSAKLTMPFHPL
jgi:hypothetical protein